MPSSSPAEHHWNSQTLAQIREAAGVAELEFHEQIGSTNDRALERLRCNDWQNPTLVLAETQTAGRGRGAHQWWSAAGSLTFSLILNPTSASTLAELPSITLRAGLAIAEALTGSIKPQDAEPSLPNDQVGLKWPNDVHLAGRKVAGLLVERVADRPGIVVGVGLNVNQLFDDAPADVRERATSLFEFDGVTRDRTLWLIRLIRSLCRELAGSAATPDSRTTELWVTRFRRRCVLNDRIVEIESLGSVKTGRCSGIDDQGRLQIKTESGSTSITSGSVLRIVE